MTEFTAQISWGTALLLGEGWAAGEHMLPGRQPPSAYTAPAGQPRGQGAELHLAFRCQNNLCPLPQLRGGQSWSQGCFGATRTPTCGEQACSSGPVQRNRLEAAAL